ncbi:MAG: tail fiber domain-containing protein [Bacteroidetes bacterium]|nr:tail fiber domain-containing protein [Bacteroidota bacterium]
MKTKKTYPLCHVPYALCLILTFNFLLSTFNSHSQNGGAAINSTGAAADNSAMLDISSTNQGIRIPRVKLLSTTDLTTIQNPVNSLLVYDSLPAGDITVAGYYYWDTTATPDHWTKLATGANWQLTGNAGTTAETNFIGTTDNKDFVFKTNNTEWARITSGGNVGIGATSPTYKLSIFNPVGVQAMFSGYSVVGSYGSGGSGSIRFGDNDNWCGRLDYNSGGETAFIFDNTYNSDAAITQFRMKTSGTPVNALSILGNGNIGIGTTNPGVKLDVIGSTSGSLRLSDCTTDATLKLGRIVGRQYTNTDVDFLAFDIRGLSNSNEINYGGGSGILNAATSHIFYTAANKTTLNGTARMIIDNNGNIGIGTTSPNDKLEVNGNVNIGSYTNANPIGYGGNTLLVAGSGGTGAVQAGATTADADGVAYGDINILNLGTTSTEKRLVLIRGLSSGATANNRGGKLAVYVKNDNSTGFTEALDISNTGNIGIGTTSPDKKLEIWAGSGKMNTLYFSEINDGSDYPDVGRILPVLIDATVGGEDSRLDFQTAYNSVLGTRVSIDNVGNVGIGTTSPAQKLDIAGTIKLTGNIIKTTDWLYLSGLNGNVFVQGTGTNQGIRTDGTSQSIQAYSAPLGAESTLALNPNGGNVGVGTASPGSYKLNVAGTLYTSGGCTGCSDQRWKKDITEIESPLQTIALLRGVQFNWRTNEYPDMFFSESKDVGLIAQEAEKVMPELVYEFDGYKYVKYDRLTPLLVEGMKEQQKMIDEQHKQIEELKTIIQGLIKK